MGEATIGKNTPKLFSNFHKTSCFWILDSYNTAVHGAIQSGEDAARKILELQ